MVSLQEVYAQLKKLGITPKFWGVAEVKELPHVLMDGEQIVGLINGRYEGGFAALVATNQRLLLIDKKPMYLTIEDVRYDMIAEVDYNARLMDSTVSIMTVNKCLRFTTIRQKPLRELTNYVQQSVMRLRQHQMQAEQHLQPQAVQADSVVDTYWVPQPVTGTPSQFGNRIPSFRPALTTKRHTFLPRVQR